MPMLWLLLPAVLFIGTAWSYRWHFLFPTAERVVWEDTVRWYRVAVQDYAVERKKTWRYEVRILPVGYRTYLYLQKDSTLAFPCRGDTLWVCTRWREAGMMGSFDYGAYLLRQGITGTGYAGSSHWTYAARCQAPPYDGKALQHRLLQRYREVGLHDAALGVVSAMTLGYREDMDPAVRQVFQRSGASHVLAVSGLHTGFLYAAVLQLLTLFGRWRPLYEERKRQLLLSGAVSSLMVLYAAVTGWSPSVTRAVVMVVLVEAARVMHRQPFSFNTLSAAAFFILCFRPQDLFSVSFQLSFAAVAAILALQPSFTRLFPVPRFKWSVVYTCAAYARDLLTVSLAATLGTLPLTLFYFGQYSRCFLLTNIVVLPLTAAIVAGALLLFTVGWLPMAGDGIGTVLQYIADRMIAWTRWMEQLPHAFTHAAPTLWQVVLLYVVIAAFAVALNRITR